MLILHQGTRSVADYSLQYRTCFPCNQAPFTSLFSPSLTRTGAHPCPKCLHVLLPWMVNPCSWLGVIFLSLSTSVGIDQVCTFTVENVAISYLPVQSDQRTILTSSCGGTGAYNGSSSPRFNQYKFKPICVTSSFLCFSLP